MSERTYTDAEVREIFGIAASGRDASARLPAQRRAGTTLADMQSIAREVGLEPSQVARAAAMLDARPVAMPRRRIIGMPIGVGRLIPLHRAPTDSEWEQIVTELRTTFGAHGKVSGQGGLREWSNGNLHAYIEPADGRYRLRISTVKGNVMAITAVGAGGIIISWMGLVSAVLGGFSLPDIIPSAVLGTAGVGTIIANYVRLPRWARQREEQMDYIASKVPLIVTADSPSATPPLSPPSDRSS